MKKLSRREREKNLREEEIIDAAEKLFFNNGYDHVTMDEIAKEADFTKRTVYQYFTGKEDLYFAVALRGFKKMYIYFKNTGKEGKNGFERLKFACYSYYNFFKENPQIFKIMNYIGYIKKNTKDSPKQKEWLDFDDNMFGKMAQGVRQGIEDGSIRKDKNPEMITYSLAFILTGFFNQLAMTGKTYTEHFNIQEEEFILFSLNLLLDSIKK